MSNVATTVSPRGKIFLGRIFFAALMLLPMGSLAVASDLESGRRVFRVCSQCHVIDRQTNLFGPYLKGVVGRPAASVPGYRYSEAMTQAGASGLVWDEAALSAFLNSSRGKVPGTSMSFWGLWRQSEIDDVVAYLRANP